MSTHNIGFYEEMAQISSFNYHQIRTLSIHNTVSKVDLLKRTI